MLIKKSYNKEEKKSGKKQKPSVTEIELQKQERKIKSRLNQQSTWSRQKIQGFKLKDRNRKALKKSKVEQDCS